MNTTASLLLLAASAATAVAQTEGWLPVEDLAATTLGLVPPAVVSVCVWDRDGDGPLPPQFTASGVLNLVIPGAKYVITQDGDGWSGLSFPVQDWPRAMTTFSPAPGAPANLFVAFGGTTVYELRNGTWTSRFAAGNVGGMRVLDLDGDGPQLPKLVVGARTQVKVFDGTSVTTLSGGVTPSYFHTMVVFDADGPGPQPPRLLAGDDHGILMWDGSAWVTFAATNAGVWALELFDFDGSGPNPPELVAGGYFATIGGSSAPYVAVRRNDTWTSPVAGTYTGRTVLTLHPFDPDGAGPLPLRLIAGGRFTEFGGVAVQNIAYIEQAVQSAWHAFPTYALGMVSSLATQNQAEFSNSPQLLVGMGESRPAVGIYALCDSPPSIVDQPSDVGRPLGSSIQLRATPAGDELVFRWYKGTQALSSGTTASGSIFHGVYSPRLSISNLTAADAGEYHLHVGNCAGALDSAAAMVRIGCGADFNGDFVVDFMDYSDFIIAFVAGDMSSDFNFDGQVDFFDYLDFADSFSNGC